MLNDLVAALESDDVEACAQALHALSRHPEAFPQMRQRLEPLIEDQRCTALTSPRHFGELRLLVGHACARLLASEGDPRVVRIAHSPGLYSIEELNEIARPTDVPLLGAPDLFGRLRDEHLLPLRDRFFDPAQINEEFGLDSAPLAQAIYEAAAAGVDGHLIQIIPGPLAIEP